MSFFTNCAKSPKALWKHLSSSMLRDSSDKILTPNYIWKEQKNSSYSQVIRGEPFTSGISEYFAESEAVCVRNSWCCTVRKNTTSVFHCYEILVLLETLSLSTFICKIKCKFEQYGVNYKWYILTNERVGRKFDLGAKKFWISYVLSLTSELKSFYW